MARGVDDSFLGHKSTALECWLLSFWFQSLPLYLLLTSVPDSVLFPGLYHCGLWPGSYNVKVSGEYPETSKKKGGRGGGLSPVSKQEADPGLWGDLQLAPRNSLTESNHFRVPRTLPYTFFKAPFSQITKCTYPKYTKCLSPLCLAYLRLTGLLRKTVLIPLLRVILPSTRKPFLNLSREWGTQRSFCPFSI